MHCEQCNTPYRTVKSVVGVTIKEVVRSSAPLISKDDSTWYENELGLRCKKTEYVFTGSSTVCCSCNRPAEMSTCSYGRIFLGIISQNVETGLQLEEEELLPTNTKSIRIPLVKTGVICSYCFETVDGKEYKTPDGQSKPCFVALAWPKPYMDHGQFGGPKRADRDEVKSVTVVTKETDEEVEEWVVPQSMRGMALGITNEPVDPKSYGYFTRSRRGSHGKRVYEEV